MSGVIRWPLPFPTGTCPAHSSPQRMAQHYGCRNIPKVLHNGDLRQQQCSGLCGPLLGPVAPGKALVFCVLVSLSALALAEVLEVSLASSELLDLSSRTHLHLGMVEQCWAKSRLAQKMRHGPFGDVLTNITGDKEVAEKATCFHLLMRSKVYEVLLGDAEGCSVHLMIWAEKILKYPLVMAGYAGSMTSSVSAQRSSQCTL